MTSTFIGTPLEKNYILSCKRPPGRIVDEPLKVVLVDYKNGGVYEHSCKHPATSPIVLINGRTI